MNIGDLPFLDSLVQGRSIKDAASAAGISERTAYRRLNCPEFTQLIDDAKRAHVEAVGTRLSSILTKSIETVASLMESDSDTVRLKASQLAFEMQQIIAGQLTVERRLSLLESEVLADE